MPTVHPIFKRVYIAFVKALKRGWNPGQLKEYLITGNPSVTFDLRYLDCHYV